MPTSLPNAQKPIHIYLIKKRALCAVKALTVNGVHLLTLNAPTTAKTPTIPKVTLGNIVGLCLTTYKDLSTYLEAMNLL